MKIKAYQICYSPETLASVPEGFHALNYTDNSRPDWREFWPIRQFLLNNYLADDTLYGFLSPKFNHKTGLDFSAVSNFINSNYTNQDIVTFSPFWDLSSLFKNIYEQGDFFHPGLLNAVQLFANHHLSAIDLNATVTHSNNTVFCNYFFAKASFWKEWLKLANLLYLSAEKEDSELFNVMNADTTYGTNNLPMKIFIQERLATTCLLLNSNLRTLSYNIFKLNASTTPFNQFLDESILSDSLKLSYIDSGHSVYLNSFALIRNRILTLMPKLFSKYFH
jgi:hypothetical protein